MKKAMEFLELCKKMISINSTPSKGNEEVALFCADLCRQAGLDVTLLEAQNAGRKEYNLIARPPNSSKKNEVIFQTHLDTVDPGSFEKWTKTNGNPFNAQISNGKIYGLGTADVKLDFLCKLRSLKEFSRQKMRNPFVLIGTFDEEVAMLGARLLMESKAVHSKIAFIGEPSELHVSYANNGGVVVEVDFPFSVEERNHLKNLDPLKTSKEIFNGKAAHSSTPHLGENAIRKLMDHLSKIPSGSATIQARGGTATNVVPSYAEIEIDKEARIQSAVSNRLTKFLSELQKLEKEFSNFYCDEFTPPTPTLNLGILKTSATGVQILIGFRIIPTIEQSQIHKWVTNLESAAEKVDAHCRTLRQFAATITPITSPLIQGCLEIARTLKLPDKPIPKAGGAESNIYRPCGIECVVFGPGVSTGNSHTPNEYNILKHLDQASEFYTEAVKKFCV